MCASQSNGPHRLPGENKVSGGAPEARPTGPVAHRPEGRAARAAKKRSNFHDVVIDAKDKKL